MVPTRILYSIQSRERARENLGQRTIALQHGTGDALTESRERSEMEAVLEKTLDPTAGSPATEIFVAGIINLFVDDLCGKDGNEMEQHVLTRLRRFSSWFRRFGMI